MASNIVVKITENQEILGEGPIVIIGPNGSGKTRHAVAMLGWNNAEMVAALRNIALSENVGMQPLPEAERNLTHLHERRKTRYWELSDEINQLFSKLMAEDSASAVSFRDRCLKGENAQPEGTKLTSIREMWERLFPGRQINFSGYKPEVSSVLGGSSSSYPAQQMSDGERVAVYLAARVIDTSKAILIVDEPEVHFHSRLAARFWNEVEDMRSNVRLVYVTHDLPFALSRRNATYVIMKSPGNPSIVELQKEITRDLSQSLLSAASFSIHARRIVFCEGEEGKSLDYDLYSAWFQGLETTVIPVGNCRDVSETVVRFANSRLIAGLTAIGIVDRDYWPDTYLDALDESIYVLPTHEIENLLCLEGIFCAVARHFAKADPEGLYTGFATAAKSKFQGKQLVHEISERFKHRVENEFQIARNSLKPQPSMDETEKEYAQALEPGRWQTRPNDSFRIERQLVENALAGSPEDFLKVFPGKMFFNKIKDSLGIEPNAYVELICKALRATEDAHSILHALGKEIEQALQPVLPPRKETPEPPSQ